MANIKHEATADYPLKMNAMFKEYESKFNKLSELINQVGSMLSLEYELPCLNDSLCVDYILEALDSEVNKKIESSSIPPSYAVEVEMIVTIGRSLDSMGELVSKIKTIQRLNLEISEEKNRIKERFRYLYNLLGEDLIFKLAVEIGSFSHLVRVSPSEMMKYGIRNYGSPLIAQHPLVAKASPRNKEKILRKLCYKISIAVKLDLCESDFEMDLHKQMEEILDRLESTKANAKSPLPIPLSRKITRRGGIKAKKRRGSPTPNRKFTRFSSEHIDGNEQE